MTMLYHGTSSRRAANILKEGALRRNSFWGTSEIAVSYATANAFHDAAWPIVFAVPAERFDMNCFISDNGNIASAIASGEELDEACTRIFDLFPESVEHFGFACYEAKLPVTKADIDPYFSNVHGIEAVCDPPPISTPTP